MSRQTPRHGRASREVTSWPAFRLIFRDRRPDHPRREVLAQVSARFPQVPEVQMLVESLRKTELGPKGRYRETLREEFLRQGRRDILGETV